MMMSTPKSALMIDYASLEGVDKKLIDDAVVKAIAMAVERDCLVAVQLIWEEICFYEFDNPDEAPFLADPDADFTRVELHAALAA